MAHSIFTSPRDVASTSPARSRVDPARTAIGSAAVMRVLDAARRSDAVGGDTVAVDGVEVLR